MKIVRRLRSALLIVVAVAVAAVLTATLPRASAESTDTGNPWVYQETDDTVEGLRINAAAGANGQPFIVYDYLGQPITWVNRAGGLYVGGDDLNVMQGDDVYNPWVRIAIATPTSSQCQRTGQLVIGGTPADGGHIWRCVAGQGWWQVL